MDPRLVFPDNVYVTVASTNNTEAVKQLDFTTSNNSEMIANPRMYYLLCEKFVIPQGALPIFMWDNRVDSVTGQRPYWLESEHNYHEMLVASNVWRGDYLGETSVSNTMEQVPIYSISQFVTLINNELASSGIKMSIDPVSGKFKFTASEIPLLNIKSTYLHLSPALMKLFPNLDNIYHDSEQLPALHNNPNKGPYHKITFVNDVAEQEFKGLYALSDIKSIMLVSNSLPVLPQSVSTNSTADKRFKILNEFIPIVNQSSDVDRSDWIFESDQYRPIDLVSEEGFNSFDYDIFLLRKSGEQIRYKLLPGDTCTMTFRFVKRALFNNEYNLSSPSSRIKQNPSVSYHRR